MRPVHFHCWIIFSCTDIALSTHSSLTEDLVSFYLGKLWIILLYIFFYVSGRCSGPSFQGDGQIINMNELIKNPTKNCENPTDSLSSQHWDQSSSMDHSSGSESVFYFILCIPTSNDVSIFHTCKSNFFVKTLIFLGFFLLHVLLIYKSHKYKRHSCMVNIFYYFFSLCQSFSNIKVLGFFIHLNSFCVLRNLFLFKVTDMVYCIILWMLYYYLWQAA